MTPTYYDLWKCMRGMEASMRYAADMLGHLILQLPDRGGEALPIANHEMARLGEPVRVFDVDQRRIGGVRCPTPPICVPAPWNTYAEWMQGVAARSAVLAEVLERIGNDPVMADAIRAFEESPAYRSEPLFREESHP